MIQPMRECVTSLVDQHDGTIVPAAVLDSLGYRGSSALTMRYGSQTVHAYDEKSCPEFTLHARRIVLPEVPMYIGRVVSPSTTIRAFMFHTDGTGLRDEAGLDAAITSFILDLVEETNTETDKWYVRPKTRTLQEAFADYPYDFGSATDPRPITLTAPATGAKFVRPSNLCVSDLRFVSLCRSVEEGDVLLETDATPDEVLDDVWFEQAEAGVSEEMTLEVRERSDGGAQFVVSSVDTPNTH